MRILRNTLRVVGLLVLILLLLLVAAFFIVRFYFAPNLNQWRPELQAWVHQEIHPGLHFDKFAISWQGLEPELVLQGTKILNQENKVEGSVEQVNVQMNWMDIVSGRIQVQDLRLDQAQLTIYRDKQGYVRLADEAILYNPYQAKLEHNLPSNRELHEREEKFKSQLQQIFDYLPANVHLSRSQIIWRDEQRQSPELVLDEVQFDLTQGLKGLQLKASILPPENLAGPLQVQADLSRLGKGRAKIKFDHFYPQVLRHWIDLPVLISQGYMEEAQLSIGYQQGSITDFSFQSQWQDFVIHEDQGEKALDIRADAITVNIDSTNGMRLPYEFNFAASNLGISSDEVFRHPLSLFGVQANGRYSETEQLLPRIEVDSLRARLPTGAVQAHGAWQVDPNSDNGLLDIEAQIGFLDLADLPRLLPKAIDANSLDWLEAAFVNGEMENVALKIQGVVDHIPFGRRPESGIFHVQGDVKNVLLNYHQQDDRGGKRWPQLITKQARIDFLNDAIHVTAAQAQLEGSEALHLHDVEAKITNIEKGTVVNVQANLQATGQDFVGFYRTSPLQRILNGALDQSVLEGHMSGNLALTIPISDVDASRVDGRIALSQASFQFEPIYPALTQAQGELRVSEKNLRIDKLQGQLLGGPVSAQGSIGSAGDSLQFNGELTGQGLRDFLPLKGLQRIQGKTAYTARLDFLGQDRLNFSLSSALKGLAINMPGSLKKSATQEQALEVQWQDKRPQGTRQLHVNLGKDQVRAIFERIDKSARFFHRGVVAVNRAPSLPTKNLSVLIKGGQWDLVQWEDLVDEFDQRLSTPRNTTKNSRSSQDQGGTFPELYQLDLEMDHMDYHFLHVDNMHLLGNRVDSRNWQLQLRSADIQGRLEIRMSEDLKDLQALKGRYDHIHWRDTSMNSDEAGIEGTTAAGAQAGTKSAADGSSAKKRLDLPNIDIEVKRLSVYGKSLGSLNLKGIGRGKNAWQLDELSLHNDVGSLFATGSLQSNAQSTAADIRLNLNALDMGKFLTHFGLGDVINGGNGFVNGRIQVPDVRNIALNNLQAQWEAQITQGSLLSVKSKAVKALEFISLQSLSRLSQVGEGHRLFGAGLQFDYVRGHFDLTQQRLNVADFRLDGPLVAVVAMGHTHLQSKQLDFQAVAVPKIEMSGAAILSGIIVNPIVGVGAFLTQWLLQEPLGRALTQRFHVTGNWDQVKLDDVPSPSDEQLKDKDTQRKIDDLYRN